MNIESLSNKELDTMAATEVMKWTLVTGYFVERNEMSGWKLEDDKVKWLGDWSPTTDLNDAGLCLETIDCVHIESRKEAACWLSVEIQSYMDGLDYWVVTIKDKDGKFIAMSVADTKARAWTIAAIKVKRIEMEPQKKIIGFYAYESYETNP